MDFRGVALCMRPHVPFVKHFLCKSTVRLPSIHFLASFRKNKWSSECFNAVDWEHLDLALKNNPIMYKIWRSKQHSGFWGTRVQVGRYSGQVSPDERCPNCGWQETAAHLMIYPDDGHTWLLGENVVDLTAWMSRDDQTGSEILNWIPKYILIRGD